MPHFPKQSRKTWYEHRDGKISAELFRKHTQTIVTSSNSSKTAEVISIVKLEGYISWVEWASLLCLILFGIFSSGLGSTKYVYSIYRWQ